MKTSRRLLIGVVSVLAGLALSEGCNQSSCPSGLGGGTSGQCLCKDWNRAYCPPWKARCDQVYCPWLSDWSQEDCLSWMPLNQLPSSSGRYCAACRYRHTKQECVQVLRDFPTRDFVRLGDVFIEPMFVSPTEAEVEETFRKGGGKMGADAVVIVFDCHPACGLTYGGCETLPYYGNTIRAVAIKYTSPCAVGQGSTISNGMAGSAPSDARR